jgi:hypothetical protein
MRVVQQPIEDRIGECWVGEIVVPVVDGELAQARISSGIKWSGEVFTFGGAYMSESPCRGRLVRRRGRV